MSAIHLNLNDDVMALLYGLNRPLPQLINEMITVELYRRGIISSGKAAQFLNMSRLEFIHYASRLGIPFFDMTEEEWQIERQTAEAICV